MYHQINRLKICIGSVYEVSHISHSNGTTQNNLITNRIDWIDAVRGIGIIAIMAFHSGFLPFSAYLVPIFNPWMIAIFPFTAGVLFRNTFPTIHLIKNKIKHLMIPFLIAGLVSYFGWIFLQIAYPQHILENPLLPEFLRFLLGQNTVFNGPVWFMPCFFLSSVCFILIFPILSKTSIVFQLLTSLGVISLGVYLSEPFQYTVFSYDLSLIFLGLVVLGNSSKTIHLFRFNKIITFLILLILYPVGALNNGIIDMFQRQFHISGLYIFTMVLGSILVSLFVPRLIQIYLPLYKILIFIGKHSLPLFLWHWPVMQWITFIFFQTGLLTYITNTYTITSFIINQTGIRFIILQFLFCLMYVCGTVTVIIGMQKILNRIINKE